MSAWQTRYPKVNQVYDRRVRAAQNVAIASSIYEAPPGDHGGAFYHALLQQYNVVPKNERVPFGAYKTTGCDSLYFPNGCGIPGV
jgi:hypothetical protein